MLYYGMSNLAISDLFHLHLIIFHLYSVLFHFYCIIFYLYCIFFLFFTVFFICILSFPFALYNFLSVFYPRVYLFCFVTMDFIGLAHSMSNARSGRNGSEEGVVYFLMCSIICLFLLTFAFQIFQPVLLSPSKFTHVEGGHENHHFSLQLFASSC
jgi:hypothetical protein